AGNGQPLLQVMKTIHTSHAGKLSIARVISGRATDATELRSSSGETGEISGIYRMFGKDQFKLPAADEGVTVALGKLDEIATGDTLGTSGPITALVSLEPPSPVSITALRPRERKDDVKLSAALQRLVQEDPSLSMEQNQDTGETIVSGHGEMHLRVTVERLDGKYQIPVDSHPPPAPYRETIRKSL